MPGLVSTSSSQAHTPAHTHIHILPLPQRMVLDGTSLWRYCKHSKNVKTRHEDCSTIKRQLESDYSTSTDHAWSMSDIYMADLS